MTQRLVVDLGGTHFRIGIFNAQDGSLSHIQRIRTAELASVAQGIELFGQAYGRLPKTACFAVAGPINHDCVSLTNLDWSFSVQALKQQFGFDVLEIINDFTAVAQSIPHLKTNESVQIGGGDRQATQPISVCGPGTGLGVAHLIPIGQNHWKVISGEGGHVDFPAINALEDQILTVLRRRFDRVSAERLLCGSGLSNLHMARMQVEKGVKVTFAPQMITQAAIDGDEDCQKSFSLFCEMLGRFAGNLALTFSSYGGVYLAGGIMPRYINFLQTSLFRKAFDGKGRLSDYVQSIPVFVVTHKATGLLGAGYYLEALTSSTS